MTAPDAYSLVHQLRQRPGAEHARPLHYWEDDDGHSAEYCASCAERIGAWLDRFLKIGWMTAEQREAWQCAREDSERDTSCPRCNHCGRLLKWTPSEYCIERELDHWEACTDDELRQGRPDELEAIAWGLQWLKNEPLADRLRACILRFLHLTQPPQAEQVSA